MSYTITWHENNPVVTLKGHVDFEALNSANNAIIGDSRFDDMRYQIFDHRDIERYTVNDKELEMIGVFDKNSEGWNKKVRVALVISDPEVVRSVQRYVAEMSNSSWKVMIFNDFLDAEHWCNQ
jgi:hypothetical protein